MSGDVQPRKRKEKRRKRAEEEYHIQRIRRASLEDDDSGTPPPMLVNPLEQSMENVTIHIHKEGGGTGGHWCARILFFALFTVLIGLIGVIIFEYRGTTDVDTPVAASRWATIFEGWVDDIAPLHEEESHNVDKHEEEDEGLGSEGEEDDEDGGEVDNANGVSEEDEEEENSLEQSLEGDGDDDEEEEDEEDEGNDNENDEGFEDDNGGDDDDEEDIEVLDEVDDEESLETAGNDDEDEEEDEGNEEEDVESLSPPDLDVSIEGINHSAKEYEEEEEEDELDYEFVAIPGVNEIDDDSAEPLEEIEEEEPEDVINEIEVEPLLDDTMEEESTSVAVKFGVGVALVVAAHFVLVRRWNNVDADLVAYTDDVRDLTRRNTIVPPANAKQLIVTGNVSQKHQQAQNVQELKSKYKNLQNENVQLITNKLISPVGGGQKVIKKELDVRTPSQIKKKESQEVATSESERCSGTENESDYDYDEDELDDEEVEEEEEEDEEVEDDGELDDTELVAKLEAKYGKIPTPSQSEEEEEEEDESEEEEDEDEEEVEEKSEEGIDSWKRSNAPKTGHSGGTDKTKDNNNRAKESMKTHQGTSASRGGRQTADIGHSDDHNELTFQDEIENWLAGDLDN